MCHVTSEVSLNHENIRGELPCIAAEGFSRVILLKTDQKLRAIEGAKIPYAGNKSDRRGELPYAGHVFVHSPTRLFLSHTEKNIPEISIRELYSYFPQRPYWNMNLRFANF